MQDDTLPHQSTRRTLGGVHTTTPPGVTFAATTALQTTNVVSDTFREDGCP